MDEWLPSRYRYRHPFRILDWVGKHTRSCEPNFTHTVAGIVCGKFRRRSEQSKGFANPRLAFAVGSARKALWCSSKVELTPSLCDGSG
jgi:hypothetical protein